MLSLGQSLTSWCETRILAKWLARLARKHKVTGSIATVARNATVPYFPNKTASTFNYVYFPSLMFWSIKESIAGQTLMMADDSVRASNRNTLS